MPIYEYGCDDCGDQFETTQNISEDPLDTCSKCNGKLRRLISASAFHLKGTGWYKTDYASPKAGESEKKDKTDAPAKTESKKETGTDTKKIAKTPATN